MSNPNSNRRNSPKRKSGQGSIYFRKDGRWEACWFEYTPEGKKRRATYGSTEEIVEAKMLERRGIPMPNAAGDDEDGDHVYFIQACSGGPIKIGITNNVTKRVKNIQACCPIPLQLLHVVKYGGPTLESELHNRFKLYRLHGEWFENTAELLSLVHDYRKKDKAKKITQPITSLARVW